MSSERKKDHIDLAFASRLNENDLDLRFYYEPMLSAHPGDIDLSIFFLDHKLRAPIWVSSMTGGTEKARTINENLARACAEFGLGMGLGSCRALLYDNTNIDDFDVHSAIEFMFGRGIKILIGEVSDKQQNCPLNDGNTG